MMNPQHDANIPTLTEIIPVIDPSDASNQDPAALAPPTQSTGVSSDPAEPAEPLPAPVVAEPSVATASHTNREWAQMEQEVSERVLAQLMSRIDFVLEQRIRDSLADVLQTAMTGLSEELRAGLQQMLETVVTRAVSQELIHLQKSKTQNIV